MEYNGNVILKHEGSIRAIVKKPFLIEIIVLDLLYFSVVMYKVDINIRPKWHVLDFQHLYIIQD